MTNKLEILVVEDREENRKAAQEFFDNLGKFSVDYATNLEEAKIMLSDKNYFLGIFDLDMPNKSGEEIIEKAGLGLGKIAKEKDMFYVYFSGGFFHGTPRTKIYFTESEALDDKTDENTYSKESSRGWEELYEKLVGIGEKSTTSELKEELEESIDRYVKNINKIPKITPKELIPYVYDNFYEILSKIKD